MSNENLVLEGNEGLTNKLMIITMTGFNIANEYFDKLDEENQEKVITIFRALLVLNKVDGASDEYTETLAEQVENMPIPQELVDEVNEFVKQENLPPLKLRSRIYKQIILDLMEVMLSVKHQGGDTGEFDLCVMDLMDLMAEIKQKY